MGKQNARSLDCDEFPEKSGQFIFARDDREYLLTSRVISQNPHFWQPRPEVGHPPIISLSVECFRGFAGESKGFRSTLLLSETCGRLQSLNLLQCERPVLPGGNIQR